MWAPWLDYCSAVQSGFSNNSLKSLQLIQNAAKVSLHIAYNASHTYLCYQLLISLQMSSAHSSIGPIMSTSICCKTIIFIWWHCYLPFYTLKPVCMPDVHLPHVCHYDGCLWSICLIVWMNGLPASSFLTSSTRAPFSVWYSDACQYNNIGFTYYPR